MVTKEKPKTKKKKWTRTRHKVITEIARVVLVPYMKLRYHISITKFREKKKRNYLILLNHQKIMYINNLLRRHINPHAYRKQRLRYCSNRK